MLKLALLGLALSAHAAQEKSKVLPGVIIDDRGRPEERKLLEEVLARLQTSAAIKALEPRRRALPPVTIGFANLSTSTNAYTGARGRSNCDLDPPQVLVSEMELEYPEYLASTIAHELYGHCIIMREALIHGLDLGYVVENEAFAFAIGAVGALETGGHVEDDVRNYALTAGTGTYVAEVLFREPKLNTHFSLEETADPGRSFKARALELERRRGSLAARRRGTELWRWRIEHFKKAHRVDPRSFKDLDESIENTVNGIYPAQQRELDEVEPELRNHNGFMTTPDSDRFVQEVVALSTNPYLRRLHDDWVALARIYAAIPDETINPPGEPVAVSTVPAVAQIDWAGLEEMSVEDAKKHPAHWKRAPPLEAAAPAWLVPWPPTGW